MCVRIDTQWVLEFVGDMTQYENISKNNVFTSNRCEAKHLEWHGKTIPKERAYLRENQMQAIIYKIYKQHKVWFSVLKPPQTW